MVGLSPEDQSGRLIGRYVLYDPIASGGMATIHLGRLIGQVGFARTVAIKRLHPHFARDPEFVAMFIDEARVAAGISHPNVVATLDVVALEGELFLVMEYVEGESLSRLIKATLRSGNLVPPSIVSSVVCNMCYGLHAAHTAKDERGQPLNIVHRDVSPQNVIVGLDGIARVLDFGVARASRRIIETEAGRVKGKFRYMAPEQIRANRFDHRVDVFATGIVLWEALTGRPLFSADEPMRSMTLVLEHPIEPPSTIVPGLPSDVDAIVLKALARDPNERYQSTREIAVALESALPPAVSRVVGEWVTELAGPALKQRAERLIELGSEPAGEKLPTFPSSQAATAPALVSGSAEKAPAPVQAAGTAAEPAQGATNQDTDLTIPMISPAPAAAASAASPSAPLAAEAPGAGQKPAVAGASVEPTSQVSEVSVAAWDTQAKRSLIPADPRRRMLLAGVASGALLAVLVIALVIRSSSTREEAGVEAASAGTASPAVAPAPVAPTPVAPTPAAPTPVAPDEPAPQPVASASSVPAAPTKKPNAAARPPAPAGIPAKPAVTAKPASDCNPPYTIDANGIKKYKRNCM